MATLADLQENSHNKEGGGDISASVCPSVCLSVCIAPTDRGLHRRQLPQVGDCELAAKVPELACAVRHFARNAA
jgi:hypothetical protein